MLKLVVSNPPTEDACSEALRESVRCLREEAEHLEALAAIWTSRDSDSDFQPIGDNYRRQARRIRETATAIERDQQAGPFEPLPLPMPVDNDDEWGPF